MKIIYTKGRVLFTLSLLVALLGVNFNALATPPCTPPTLSATPTDMTCHGTTNGSVSLTVSGGSLPYSFSWTSSTGFMSTNQNISGLDSGSYTVVVTEGGTCTSTTTVIVSEPAPLTVFTASNAPFCPGGTLTLYATPTGGTAAYAYSWSGPAGFSSTDQSPNIPAATAANNGVYNLLVTDAHSCTVPSTFSVLLYPSPVVNLGADAYICGSGGSTTLNAGNPGSTYVWNTSATTQIITVTLPGSYWVTATNFYACSESDTNNVSASPYVTPTDTIHESLNNICFGVPVTFTATVTNGGTNPSFNWSKNGLFISGATNSTYTDAALNNGDYIVNRVTSNFPCALPVNTVYSDSIFMGVTANLPVSVTMTHTPDTACSGTPVTFSATGVNGGGGPSFQWIRGGVVVGSGTSYTYSPTTTDTVIVNMVSSLVCHQPDTARDTSTFVIYPHLIPYASVSFSPNDTVAYLGAVVTFFCASTYAGTSPTFQWYVNRVAVVGATNSSYARHVYENDTVRCVVRSNAICAIPNKDTSNAVIIYASFLDVTDINATGNGVSLFPNPTAGNFTLTGAVGVRNDDELQIEVMDLKGSVVYRKSIASQRGQINEPLNLAGQLANGVYFLRIISDADQKQLKLIINK
ncbi:hypothetical protein CJD36_014810 [Flavipsychrobacter stenotrophus]|uniref:Ig-like domain-containing protein n=1 Tax=Flavipsychrobacter stenotrophus TaxID=2077091 RepID=A0A2S7STD9_9BACT|nr:T9SS type A sorting domain-containing protein [Flavipsychrobacter stenotrophus]PQJ09968.1 hypothetical protein CJD36_014810 [Flavipsychrobacter stenotrophus]